jgi:DNA primase
MKRMISCAEAKQIDIVDYLASLGYQPQKIRTPDYWYLSPLREEKTPSFKVNKKLNIWYDHATGQGGDIIDFGTAFYKCSVSDFLEQLQSVPSLSFHPPSNTLLPAVEKKKVSGENDGKIKIISAKEITSDALKNYLAKRAISIEIANCFCKEVAFTLYNKNYIVLGFPNRSGGYELRSEHFKGSSSPKDVSFIDNKTENIAVFEGFFSFLSFQTINKNQEAPLTNCLVLNSLAFFEKSRPLMEQYQQIHLLLDNDSAGKTYMAKALQWSSKYIDRSDFYKHHKDLNSWLVENNRIKQSQHKGISRGL